MMPVKALTWATSSIFSKGSRGTPAVVKTRKRVPESPKVQLGSSMVWVWSRLRDCGGRSAREGVAMRLSWSSVTFSASGLAGSEGRCERDGNYVTGS